MKDVEIKILTDFACNPDTMYCWDWDSFDEKTILPIIIHLLNEYKKQKEVIDKIMNLIKQYGKYDGKKCTRGFQMWGADFNKILDILKEVSE